MEGTLSQQPDLHGGRPRLFAMVTTHKSRDYTPIAISSFLAVTPLRPSDRFILISNDDPEIGSVVAGERRVELISNPEPRGFAENANAMIERALETGSDLIFMNNDVVFFDGWLAPLVGRDDAILSPLSNREVQYAVTVAVVASQHIAQTSVLRAPMELDEYRASPHLFAAIAETHRKSAHGTMPVIVLPFYCIRLPLPVLRSIGKFDTRFGPAGGEDYDYCFRAWLGGYSVEFELGSYLLHFWGKSTSEPGGGPLYDRGFLPAFKEKWGEALFKWVFEEDGTLVDANPEAFQFRERRDLGGVVRTLAPGNPRIHIP